MPDNLLKVVWNDLDSVELMILLYERIGRPGQYEDIASNQKKFYLPLAGSSCRVALIFREKKIVAIERGVAFDATEWDQISKEIEQSILVGPPKVGREYSFSSYRVTGSWRGDRSGVQILPAPDDAPRASDEMADHPFILEFPIKATDCWPVTNHRRMREHRRLTLLLNVLLRGHTSLQSNRPAHFWASVPRDNDRCQLTWVQKVQKFLFRLFGCPWTTPCTDHQIKWVQQFFFAKLGNAVIDELSPPAGKQLEEIESEEYYMTGGHDGNPLRVPADLDQSICLYMQLSPMNRAKFDRATFWRDMASRQWTISASSSFGSLVSAVESLTNRGSTHRVYCNQCEADFQHEVPSATGQFRAILEKYSSGEALNGQRNKMYDLRSRILHGSELMQLDQEYLYLGWDPLRLKEEELYNELWVLTRVALRNWLKNPPTT